MDASSVSDTDSEYDLVESNPGLDSSVVDLESVVYPSSTQEPTPTQAAREQFRDTVNLKKDDIQSFVAKFIEASKGKTAAVNSNGTGTVRARPEERMVRVYVDGLFDGFNVANALQLRQAKLSFPSVHLMVGVFSDELCEQYGSAPALPHVERCEVVRHCRWVDEVVSDAPWRVDEYLLRNRRIDYVAVEEGITVDPHFHSARLKGYDELKSLGRTIPTRRTNGLSVRAAPSTPVPRTETRLLVPRPLLMSTEVEYPTAKDSEKDDATPEPNEQMDIFGIGL